MKYARIVPIFAEQTGITLEAALDFFYTSSIYQMMNEGIADMHCRSDGYLANLVKEEWKKCIDSEFTLQLILSKDMRKISARIKCCN